MFDWIWQLLGLAFDGFLYIALFVCACMVIINVVNYFTSDGVEEQYVMDGKVYDINGKEIQQEENDNG